MATSNPDKQQQAQRDVKRVLQVLLPTLAPPQIDLVHNTFFASASLSQAPQQNHRSNFRLRRVDSGQLGNFHVESTHWGTGPKSAAIGRDLKLSQFSWADENCPPSDHKGKGSRH